MLLRFLIFKGRWIRQVDTLPRIRQAGLLDKAGRRLKPFYLEVIRSGNVILSLGRQVR